MEMVEAERVAAMETIAITPNYDATGEIAMVGIRRASVFMSVGVNAGSVHPYTFSRA